MKKCFFAVSALVVALFAGCQSDFTQDLPEGVTVFEVELPGGESRTELGAKEGDTYPIYWSEGDRIVVNGVQSKPVEIKENRKSASYEVEAVLNAPYRVTYPYTSATSAEKPMVDFPALQNYKEGSFDMGAAPMCGYISGGNSLMLNHLAGVLCFSLKASEDNTTLNSIVITSEEALSGVFEVDCQNATISETEQATNTVTYTIEGGLGLSTSSEKKVYITLPYGNRGVCHLSFNYNSGKKFAARLNGSNIKAGFVHAFPTLTIKENKAETNLDEMYEVDIPNWDFSFETKVITGTVRSYLNYQGIPDVVVSDGYVCTKTDKNGKYTLYSTSPDAKFVMISIPSGYMPSQSDNRPQFYKKLTSLSEKNGSYTANFYLYKRDNEESFSLLVAADPQPRPSDYEFDNNAYHSLDCCDDLYADMKETATTIKNSGREVYGLMLGDIVHENASLFGPYVSAMSDMGFEMFNVLGNHDNKTSAQNDIEGRVWFENYFGPTYYSFNMGNVHFVVLDNLIMKLASNGKLTDASDQGLTDEIMEWLSQDLSYVDKSKILMVAAHSPMTKLRTGGSRTNAAKHFADYTALFKEFAQAHIWSGHTHKTFNYNYPESSSLYPIEEHTVARSTGELWTNEYEVGGTPRGYVVVNVDGNNVSWKFKPTIYQTGAFVSSDYTPYQPNYTHRDWNYNSSGIAKMKSDGSTLSDSYQMKIYAPGTYHDTFANKVEGAAANDYIYINVFMWDNKWQVPTFNGQQMEHVAYNTAYSLAEYEIINHYYKYGYSLKDYASYKYNYGKEVYVHTIFRIKAPSATGSGTVSVVDRFGNTYSSSISW